MAFSSFIKSAALAAAALGLAGCATGFSADVSRFNQMPAPQGQTFVIEAADTNQANSLEFANYAAMVRGEMARLGYVPATGASSDLIVRMAYGVDQGREKIRPTAGFYNPSLYDPFYRGGYGAFGGGYGAYGGGFYRPRVIRTRRGYRYIGGFYDPFLWGPSYSGFDEVRSYTVYTGGLDLKIDRRADGQRLFEGSAEAQSRDNDLTYLVPNLVDAMFTGFPGDSRGRKVRITLPPRDGRG